jgi:UDP:flavonoid glycosyltransferase YjiC (YdhE family)
VRFLFATTRGAGHLGPLVPYARACLRAGHRVLVVGPAHLAPLAALAGLPFQAVSAPPPRERAAAWAPVFSRNGKPSMAHVVRELFIGLDGVAALPGMLAAVEAFAPDLIVRETCEFASCVAAERFDVPLAQVGIHLDSQLDADERLIGIGAPALGKLGLTDLDRLASAPVLTCVPRALEDPSQPSPERLRRFRAPGAGAPHERLGPPLVYVSFGSEAPATEWFPGLYRDVITGLSELPVRVLVTIGEERDPAELGPLPPRVRVERWVSQAEVMPHASAMVGHGGSGSTLLALAAGVPVALIPLFVDGPANAERVTATGAGLTLPDASEIAGAVARLLLVPGYRRAAAEIAGEIRALPPVDDAVEGLLALA